MRDVRPPISFRFDIAQNHIFNRQRQTRHFPRHIYTKIIKLWLLVGNQHIFKLTSFETTPCYHNNKKKYKINTIPYKSQPKQSYLPTNAVKSCELYSLWRPPASYRGCRASPLLSARDQSATRHVVWWPAHDKTMVNMDIHGRTRCLYCFGHAFDVSSFELTREQIAEPTF